MGKISNFSIIVTTVVALAAIILFATISTVNKNHNNLLLYSMESNVEYQAKRCFLEKSCSDSVTIQTLIDKGYLSSSVVNPVTKEIIPNDKTISISSNGKITINW